MAHLCWQTSSLKSRLSTKRQWYYFVYKHAALSNFFLEFIDMLSSMRMGVLTPQIIQRFNELSRPVVYNDGIEASVLCVFRLHHSHLLGSHCHWQTFTTLVSRYEPKLRAIIIRGCANFPGRFTHITAWTAGVLTPRVRYWTKRWRRGCSSVWSRVLCSR